MMSCIYSHAPLEASLGTYQMLHFKPYFNFYNQHTNNINSSKLVSHILKYRNLEIVTTQKFSEEISR